MEFTTYVNLERWYLDKLDLDFDDFGDFTDGEIQDALVDFGVDESSKKTPPEQLEPAMDRIGRDIFDNYIIGKIADLDLNTYSKLIEERHEPILAKREGTKVAEKLIDRARSRTEFEDATEWLSDYNPRYLGYLKGIKTYREKAQGFRLIFG